jgi:predicted DNA-binding transcriptional regulator AlpA
MAKVLVPISAVAPRWARNAALARYLNVSAMCIWRWQRDPRLSFPQPSRINNIDYTDLNLVDAWMKECAVNRTKALEVV